MTITVNAKGGFKVHRYRRLMIDYEYHAEMTETIIQRVLRKLHSHP